MYTLIFMLLLPLTIFAQDYLSRDFIDTTINRAYYNFIAADQAAGGRSQEEAIAAARETAQQLRRSAETDPNARYILWRVSELEAQIALEEEERYIRNQIQRVREANALVARFNQELEKSEPSFGALHAIHAQMVRVDPNHANQLADLINRHNRYRVQLIRRDINAAFASGNYAAAEREYSYAVANRRFLNLSDGEIDEWSRRIEHRKTAEYLRANLGKSIAELSRAAENRELALARRMSSILLHELQGASSHLDQRFVQNSRREIEAATRRVEHIEDSLVAHNISLVQPGNTEPAINYMNRVLRPAGVATHKIAEVDRAILAVTQRRVDAAVQNRVSGVMAGFSFEEGSAGGSMGLSRDVVAHRRDSIRAYTDALERASDEHFLRNNRRSMRQIDRQKRRDDRDRGNALRTFSDIERELASGRYRQAQRAYARDKDILIRYAPAQKLLAVASDLNATDVDTRRLRARVASETPEGLRGRAEDRIAYIYMALGEDRLFDAYEVYYLERRFLQDNAYEAAFRTLRTFILTEYNRMYNVYN